MKVLNVGQNYRVAGGSDQYMIALTRLLDERGHDVVPFAARHPENRAAKHSGLWPEGVDSRSPGPADALRFLYSLPAREAMARLLEEWRPDLAHLHVYYGQLTASILEPLRKAGVPRVQTLHDCKLGCPVRVFLSRGEICEACGGEKFWRALPRRCNDGSLLRTTLNVLEAYVSRAAGDVEKIDRFLAPSRFLRDKMLEHEILAPDDITVLPNFVDPDRFEPADGPGEHLLFVGRLREAKGVRTLLEAAANLPGVPLLVAGTGRDREELEERAAEAGLGHVRFVGFRAGEELRDLMRRSIAVVVPSEMYENCPMTVLEAMAHGRPVVGSRIGGIPELVEHGNTGLLFPPGDARELRDQMARLADDREEAARMGAAGRRRLERRFGPEDHYRRLMAVYRELG